jgi:ATP-binding cassette subfamily C protein LapB
MDNQRIIIDGPKQAVLDELRKNDQARNKTTVQQKDKIVNKANQPSTENADDTKPATSRVRNISIKPINAKNSTDDQGK